MTYAQHWKGLALAVAGALAVSGCAAEEKETLRIGVLMSKTGVLEAYGPAQLEGIVLAVEEINAAGGVLGKQLELVTEDDGSTDAERAAAGARALADEGVPVVIGATGSGVSKAALAVLGPKGIPMISASATSPSLSTAEGDALGHFFRTCPSDEFQGKVLARRALDALAEDRVAIIYEPSDYGRGLRDSFRAAFEAGGGTIAGTPVEYAAEQPSYSQLIADVMATNPKGIVCAAYTGEAAQMLKDYKLSHQGAGVVWFFTDGAAANDFVALAEASTFSGIDHEGTQPASSPFFVDFKNSFEHKYGRAPDTGSYVTQAYDALYLAALALAKAGKAEGPAVQAALVDVSKGGEAFSPRRFEGALAKLAEGGDIDFEGASGKVDFDENGDILGSFNIWKVVSGNVEIIAENVNP